MDNKERERKWEEAQRLMVAGAYSDAARIFRELVEIVAEPLEKVGLLTSVLEALVFAGDFDRARQVISEIERLQVDDPYVPLLIKRELATIARAEGDPERSLALLDELALQTGLKQSMNSAVFLGTVKRDRGLVLAELHRFSEALPVLIEAELAHSHPQTIFYIAYCMEGLGRYQEAIPYYQRALEDPGLPEVLRAPSAAGRSRCFERVGESPRSLQ